MMGQLKTIINTVLRIGLTGLFFRGMLSGPIPELKYSLYQETTRLPVDQVFRDYYGYRVSFSDSQGLVHERIFRSDYGFGKKVPKNIPQNERNNFKFLEDEHSAFIIKDLPQGRRGYVNIATFNQEAWFFIPQTINHAEVHIPQNQNISPGYEAISSGKSTTYHNMGEIR